MKKIVRFLGVSALVLGPLSSVAEAKLVHYEINGKRYSYSTNNRAQTLEARKRIEAAKIAEAAKAKAEAEKSKYPLIAAFGSKTQREAAEAQERLQALLSGKSKAAEPDLADRDRDQERRTVRDDRREKKNRDAVAKEAVREERQQTAALVPEAVRPAMSPAVMAPLPAVEQPSLQGSRSKKVRSVSFDVESGIKTTIMIDGSIEEEPFDTSVLRQLVPDHGEPNSLTAFVNQLRKLAPEETTGSITPKVAQPELP